MHFLTSSALQEVCTSMDVKGIRRIMIARASAMATSDWSRTVISQGSQMCLIKLRGAPTAFTPLRTTPDCGNPTIHIHISSANQAKGAAGLSQPPVSTAIPVNQLGEAAQGLSQPSTLRATLANQGGGAALLTVGTDQPENTALVEKAARCGAVTTSRQAEKLTVKAQLRFATTSDDATHHHCKAREIIGEMCNQPVDFRDVDNYLHGAHAKSSFIAPVSDGARKLECYLVTDNLKKTARYLVTLSLLSLTVKGLWDDIL